MGAYKTDAGCSEKGREAYMMLSISGEALQMMQEKLILLGSTEKGSMLDVNFNDAAPTMEVNIFVADGELAHFTTFRKVDEEQN